MTVEDLFERMSSAEITQWSAYFRAKDLAEQQKKSLHQFLDEQKTISLLIEEGA